MLLENKAAIGSGCPQGILNIDKKGTLLLCPQTTYSVIERDILEFRERSFFQSISANAFQIGQKYSLMRYFLE